jgi:hypothetical protein
LGYPWVMDTSKWDWGSRAPAWFEKEDQVLPDYTAIDEVLAGEARRLFLQPDLMPMPAES